MSQYRDETGDLPMFQTEPGPKEPKPNTQNARVLDFMRTHGSITDNDAWERMTPPIRRLAARIFDLTELGWEIESRMVESPGGARVSRYYIVWGVLP